METKRTVHAAVLKSDDLELHVSTLETSLGQFTDIREFVVSLQQYGRGVTFPARLTEDIAKGLTQIKWVSDD